MLKELEKYYGWSFNEVSPMQMELINDVVDLTIKTMATYKGYFEKKDNEFKIYNCDEKPVGYKGYLIYHRIKQKLPCANVFDVVLNGIIKTQRMNLTACKKYIDNEIL